MNRLGYEALSHRSKNNYCSRSLTLSFHFFALSPSVGNNLSIMVSFQSSFLACLFASSSSAFAVKPTTQSIAFTQRSAPTQTTNLSISGTSSAVPDLKVNRFKTNLNCHFLDVSRIFENRMCTIFLDLISIGLLSNV